jgi:hypothetical protein
LLLFFFLLFVCLFVCLFVVVSSVYNINFTHSVEVDSATNTTHNARSHRRSKKVFLETYRV